MFRRMLVITLFLVLLVSLASASAILADHTPDPASVAIAGDLQTEVGCTGDWDPACPGSELVYDANDDVWQQVFPISAGSWQYKATLNDSWTENYGAGAQQDGANIGLDLGQTTDVKFYYDHKSHWITDNVNSRIATVPGNFQVALGCSGDWDPGCLLSWLQDTDGDGTYTFETTALLTGDYYGKVAINESWNENYGQGGVPGGSDISFHVPTDYELVRFSFDSPTNVLTIKVGSEASHDNDIWWDDLGHNSRDPLYRTPGGPVTDGTPVTLRMRAASGDLTAAKVRVWDDRINAQQLIDLHIAADDGTYEWWETTLPGSVDPTIYWYRFIAIDGTATAYYEDDESRNGGWGQTFGESPDYGWQLTVFDANFQTPDWVKNAVIYQLFPDRFRDGDPGNNPPAGRFFYEEVGGTVVRSNTAEWNTFICDPRDDSDPDCAGTYSRNFYGGDLQGVTDQLDYLQDLGITVIYFNPIFASPSNHKYDTTDFRFISEDFGDLAAFQTLMTEAHNRGMRVILDGVFNHTSSDSVYFDRYGNFASVGACESETSPYREWYFFTDVAAGAGACVGSDGTPLAATYESWFGFDSLPKLDSSNPEVRALVWDDADGGPDSIARQWLSAGADGWRFDVGGDIDPGLTNDPTNDYWEGFRATVRADFPETYMVLEEWGNASPWLLGQEMDATMNYQYSSAMLGFWRDTEFVDNDHNSGSSAGPLSPLTPTQLDGRLHNWIERYPPEALYAMMNLLGSHDTNRPLFMLDENVTTGIDDTPLQDPAYDWSDSILRLKGVALLQMTLPGAPTIYYGDEMGLVGPVFYHGGTWQDDPYNRQPFPWLDETGTPFYTHMQAGGSGRTDLLPYYQNLTAVRNSHPALRTGEFLTLLTDDAANIYAYARISPDYSDAAVVIVNRAAAAQDVSLDLTGILPVGAGFSDALNGGAYAIAGDGSLTVTAVPGMNGALLVADGPLTMPPAAVSDLAVSGIDSEQISLSWSAAAGADSYDVYRSLVSGGGYELLTNVTGTGYTDSGLVTTTAYYYVVVSRDDTTLLASAQSNEAEAIPAYNIGWANLQWPPSMEHILSAVNRTSNIYGQIWIDGVTFVPGPTPGLLAQVGFGAPGSTPDDNWAWEAMTFNVDAGNNDEYYGSLLPDELGIYCYTTRYSGDGGNSWFYAVNGPDEGNGTCPGPYGVLTVLPGADTTAPSRPENLEIAGTTTGSISLAWDAHPNADGDLYGFEVYRENVAELGFSRIASLADPSATGYVDTSVTTNETYNYYIVAFDTSYNRSAASSMVQATAEPRVVTVTFHIGVPDYTPGTVYIVGDISEFGPWNPGLAPMTQLDATTWEYSTDLLDGTELQFKFTRGSWDTVESWGAITGLNNRSLRIDFGSDGTQLVDLTATDWGTGPDDTKAVQFWRDPIVVDYSPAAGATGVSLDAVVSVLWSIPMAPDNTFSVTGPDGAVVGTFAYDPATQVQTFTPDAMLVPGATYTVLVSGAVSVGVPGGDPGVQQAPLTWDFTTITIRAQIEALVVEVEALLADGILNKGQANALITKLEGAIEKLDNGQPHVAINRLEAFVNQVNSFVDDGLLSMEVGQGLIDQANFIIWQIMTYAML